MMHRQKAILNFILGLCVSACAETSNMQKKELPEERLKQTVDNPGIEGPVVSERCNHRFLPSKQEQLCQRLLCVEKAVLNLEIDVLLPDFEFSELRFERLSETQGSNTFGLICVDSNKPVGKFSLKQTVLYERVERSLSTTHTRFLANGTLSKVASFSGKGKNEGYQGSVEGNVSFTLLAPLLQAE